MTVPPLKKFRYALEAAGLWLLLSILGCFPPKTASNFGGWIGRTLGPRFGVNKKGFKNLQIAFPEKTHKEHEAILLGMWDNLGRVIAEYPHLERLAANNTRFINVEHLEKAVKDGNGAVFASAHFGNWEVSVPAVYKLYHYKIASTYRAPNNPWTDKMLYRIRTLNGALHAHSKSAEGGRGMMQDIRNKGMIGILVDQKYNEGVAMPFFKHLAMTNPIFVRFPQKFKCALLPCVCRRIDGCNFEVTLYPQVNVFDEQGQPRSVEHVIANIHELLEGWIREHPEQWLWIHKRWKDDVYE